MTVRKGPHLSKSRYLSGLQCHLRLWNDCHARELAAEVSASQQAIFDAGHEVGRVATRRHPGGVLVDRDVLGTTRALDRTREVLCDEKVPAVFEAALRHANTLVHVDILARAPQDRWDLVEVKSSTKVKDPNPDDVAVQHWVVRGAGIEVRKAGILTLNKEYVHDGGDYDVDALFVFHDLTDVAHEKHDEVGERIAELRSVIDAPKPPKLEPGDHCFTPYDCPYYAHCTRNRVALDHPVSQLPGLRPPAKKKLAALGVESVDDLPETFPLNALQERVRTCVLNGREYVGPGLAAALRDIEYPVHHLDFEAFAPALPRYAGTRPYQAIPFQWSNHVEHRGGTLRHHEYLCREDTDPREAFAETLLDAVGDIGSICVYTGYESRILRELAEALAATAPRLARRVERLHGRLWDLHAVVREHYYHPNLHGSFSLKQVLPVLVPKLSYAGMTVADGDAAQRAYLEAITTTGGARRSALQRALLDYCGQDTLAMVEVRRVLRRKGAR
jgi:predicted RecB family nuclease